MWGGVNEYLYGLQTDILSLYMPVVNGVKQFHHGTLNLTTGEITVDDEDTSKTGVCVTYIPVNPNYTYTKSNDGRLQGLVYYDAQLNYIGRSYQNANNLNWTVLDPFPSNTAYIRFATHNLNNNWGIQIVRTE